MPCHPDNSIYKRDVWPSQLSGFDSLGKTLYPVRFNVTAHLTQKGHAMGQRHSRRAHFWGTGPRYVPVQIEQSWQHGSAPCVDFGRGGGYKSSGRFDPCDPTIADQNVPQSTIELRTAPRPVDNARISNNRSRRCLWRCVPQTWTNRQDTSGPRVQQLQIRTDLI